MEHVPRKRRSDELLETRRYVPGDDVRRLNWKLLAHAGELFLRLGEETPPPRARLLAVLDTTERPRGARRPVGRGDRRPRGGLRRRARGAAAAGARGQRVPAGGAALRDVDRRAPAGPAALLADAWWAPGDAPLVLPNERSVRAVVFALAGSPSLGRILAALRPRRWRTTLALRDPPAPPVRPRRDGAGPAVPQGDPMTLLALRSFALAWLAVHAALLLRPLASVGFQAGTVAAAVLAAFAMERARLRLLPALLAAAALPFAVRGAAFLAFRLAQRAAGRARRGPAAPPLRPGTSSPAAGRLDRRVAVHRSSPARRPGFVFVETGLTGMILVGLLWGQARYRLTLTRTRRSSPFRSARSSSARSRSSPSRAPPRAAPGKLPGSRCPRRRRTPSRIRAGLRSAPSPPSPSSCSRCSSVPLLPPRPLPGERHRGRQAASPNPRCSASTSPSSCGSRSAPPTTR